MSADGAKFEYSMVVEKEQLKDCASALLHTVLFFRTAGEKTKPKDTSQ